MWYIVLSRSKTEREENQQTRYDEHRLWREEPHKAGRLLFSDPTTDGADGIYLMLAANLEEANTIAARDSQPRRAIRSMRKIRSTLAFCPSWMTVALLAVFMVRQQHRKTRETPRIA